MSTMRQQFHPSSAKSLFRKQKSIDLGGKPASDGKKILRKQSSVDHVVPSLKQVNQPSAALSFSNRFWSNSTQSLDESSLRIAPTVSAVKKRAQFASSHLNSSALSK
jgi:hypothetical protein